MITERSGPHVLHRSVSKLRSLVSLSVTTHLPHLRGRWGRWERRAHEAPFSPLDGSFASGCRICPVRPTVTASSPLARLSAAVVVGDSPGRTAQRVARASPAGAFDRPIFFVTSPVALGFGLGYLRLSPLPTYTYGGDGGSSRSLRAARFKELALVLLPTARPSSSDLPLPINFARFLTGADF